MKKYLDEITGLMIEEQEHQPLYLIVSLDDRTAHACADTHSSALRAQMRLGLRASTKIVKE